MSYHNQVTKYTQVEAEVSDLKEVVRNHASTMDSFQVELEDTLMDYFLSRDQSFDIVNE